jgi:hypothetical protein
MKRPFMIAASLLLFGLAARAQTTPDFSGTWTRVDDAPEQASVASTGNSAFVAGSMGSGWGSPLTIRQSSAELVLEYVHFIAYDLQPPLRLRYALDGSDSSNTLMIGHAASTQNSRAQWQDQSLVITTQFPVPGSSERVEVRQVLSLESPASLLIETTRAAPGGRPPAITRTRYSKRG